MCYRLMQEALEEKTLSTYASLSSKTKGRTYEENECEVRTAFQRDRDRILHAKAFRRLAHKTQVFIAPEGDHYRTRLTHTLEVAQISRTLARALHLNEDLTEAIALGHDLGHTPFGHTGEYVLQELTGNRFSHHTQSLRVVEHLEHDGRGLNLTEEVRDGILNHQTSGNPHTLEGKIVQLSDKIAYINHDIDDAIRGRILRTQDLPLKCMQTLGNASSKRINTLILDIISASRDKNAILMSSEIKAAFYETRRFLFENVYVGSLAKEQEDKAKYIIKQLYAYYMENPEKLPTNYVTQLEAGTSKMQTVCDYIAGMTDRYALHKYCELFFPTSWDIY